MTNEWHPIEEPVTPGFGRPIWITTESGVVTSVNKHLAAELETYKHKWKVVAWKYKEQKPEPYKSSVTSTPEATPDELRRMTHREFEEKHLGYDTRAGDAEQPEREGEAVCEAIPSAEEARHLMEGVRIGKHFVVVSTGDTLRRRDMGWQLYHYPDGFDGDEVHPANEFTRYPEAIKAAKAGECEDCTEFKPVSESEVSDV